MVYDVLVRIGKWKNSGDRKILRTVKYRDWNEEAETKEELADRTAEARAEEEYDFIEVWALEESFKRVD